MNWQDENMRPLKVVISRRCFFCKRFSSHIIHISPTLISASEWILPTHKYTQLGDLHYLVCPDISCLPQNICSSCRCSRYRHYSTMPCQPENCNRTFVTSHDLLLIPQLDHYRAQCWSTSGLSSVWAHQPEQGIWDNTTAALTENRYKYASLAQSRMITISQTHTAPHWGC